MSEEIGMKRNKRNRSEKWREQKGRKNKCVRKERRES